MTLEQIAQHLEQSGLSTLPTETVYGLAARIDRPRALQKIFEIKQRPFFDPLIVHVASLEQVQLLTSQWNPLAETLAKTFWPGPLTLVLSKTAAVDSLITSGLMTVAIRWPAHPLAEKLIQLSGPLAAPSANLFGHTSPTQIEHVESEFPELIGKTIARLDGGPCSGGVESTVVRVDETELTILRPGLITAHDFKLALADQKNIKINSQPVDSKQSPGHLEHHYSPRKKLIWLKDGLELTPEQLVARGFVSDAEKNLGAAVQLPTEAVLAARMLYQLLRQADANPEAKFITLHSPRELDRPDLWDAIFDRLKRAAQIKL